MSDTLGFLRRRKQRRGPVSILPTRKADLPAIQNLLRRSPHTYAGLGGAIQEAIQADLALTAWQEEGLAGFALAHQQGPVVAWIHAFALDDDVSTSEVGGHLLRALEQEAAQAGIDWIGYMDEYGLRWLRQLLQDNGFCRGTRVVGYQAPVRQPPGRGNESVCVRPAAATDVAAVADLDQRAFGPLWAYTERVFRNVWGEAACFLVSQEGGQIRGYVLSVQHGDEYAHVVRLAVDPPWQGRGIGVRLLAETFRFFHARGVAHISLNTQQENDQSQRLYQWFGFHPTGEAMDVWTKEL